MGGVVKALGATHVIRVSPGACGWSDVGGNGGAIWCLLADWTPAPVTGTHQQPAPHSCYPNPPETQDKVLGAARRLLECASAIRAAGVNLEGASLAIDDCYELWDSGACLWWAARWRRVRAWVQLGFGAWPAHVVLCGPALPCHDASPLPRLPVCPPISPAGFISIPHDFSLSDLKPRLQALLGSGAAGAAAVNANTNGNAGIAVNGNSSGSSSGYTNGSSTSGQAAFAGSGSSGNGRGGPAAAASGRAAAGPAAAAVLHPRPVRRQPLQQHLQRRRLAAAVPRPAAGGRPVAAFRLQ